MENTENLPKTELINTEQLIGRALDKGVELGSKPHDTINLYIEQNLIPKLINGLYPSTAVERLVVIDDMLKEGKDLEEIKKIISKARKNFLNQPIDLQSLVNTYKKASFKSLLMLVSLAVVMVFTYGIFTQTPGTFAKGVVKTTTKPVGKVLAAIIRQAKDEGDNSTDPLGLTNISKVITINEKQEIVIEKNIIGPTTTVVSTNLNADKVDGADAGVEAGNVLLLDELGDVDISGNVNAAQFSGSGEGLTSLPAESISGILTNANLPSGIDAGKVLGAMTNASIGWSLVTSRPTILSSVDGVSNNLGNVDFVAGVGVTITPNDTANTITFSLAGSGVNADLLDSLNSTAFLRSDTSDSFTSGTLTIAGGTTLSVAGSFSCTNCVGDSAVSDTLTIGAGGSVAAAAVTGSLTDAQIANTLTISGGSVAASVIIGSLTDAQVADTLTISAGSVAAGIISGSLVDAQVSNTLTVDGTGSINAGSLNSGTLGAAGVTLALGSFGAITGSLSDINVADTITASNYLPLAGGTMAGTLGMGTNLIQNIGAAGTDFVAGGGLNIATDLDVGGHAAFGNIASVTSGRVLYIYEDFTGVGSFSGQRIVANYAGTDAGTGLWGLSIASDWSGTGGASAIAVYGMDLEANQFANTSIGTLYGMDLSVGSQAGTSGAITTAYAANFSSLFLGSDPTTIYGVRIQNFGNAGTTTSYGLYIDDQIGSSNNYEIFIKGTAPVFALENSASNSTLTLTNPGAGNANLTIEGTCTSEAADCAVDIAEIYDSSEPVKPGDLLSIDKGASKTVKLSTGEYDNALIGVVTSNPAIVFEEGDIVLGANAGDNKNPTRPFVALAGRVPVKVSTENGDINPGDPLTSSSIPGVAMKATKSGPIIGKALASFDCAPSTSTPEVGSDTSGVSLGACFGKIVVFVSVGWYVAPVAQDLSSQLSDLSNINVETLTAGTIRTDVLFVGDRQISINKDGKLEIDGDVEIAGDLLVTGTMKAAEINIGKVNIDTNESDIATAGKATLRAGETKIVIKTKKVTAESLIFVTPNTLTDKVLSVTDKQEGDSFTIQVKTSSSEAISFNWWVVN